jgi:hypothetical protein
MLTIPGLKGSSIRDVRPISPGKTIITKALKSLKQITPDP